MEKTKGRKTEKKVVDPEKLEKQIKKILKSFFWLPTLKSKTCYLRLHDDNDGTMKGRIMVSFSEDGDCWLRIDEPVLGLRFRTFGGGGRSFHTRNALQILALAIILDQQKYPDPD